jgi:YggT family protein
MYPERMHHEYSLSSEDAYFQRQRYDHKYDVLERAIVLAGGALTTLLGIRFVFALLAANARNGFASFVYSITEPFVTPFYGLFNYDHASVGAVNFQGYTLVAMLACSLLTAALARLVTITRY